LKNRFILACAVISTVIFTGCSHAPGRPGPHSEVIPPSEVTDFKLLYSENCGACHGHDGNGGAAISLGNPVFLAIADDAAIRRTMVNGVKGTPMPAFAESTGGTLTDKQIDVIVSGIRSWAKPGTIGGELPPYTTRTPGDPHHGAEVYATYCSSCHGKNGQGGAKASSIVDSSYLALVSNQNLRTAVIMGRPELGAPDWRNNVPGKAMSPQEISNVVAWLAAQRPLVPREPHPSPSVGTATRVIP
jgi:mono/diheme cytochrome c family protein